MRGLTVRQLKLLACLKLWTVGSELVQDEIAGRLRALGEPVGEWGLYHRLSRLATAMDVSDHEYRLTSSNGRGYRLEKR